MDKIRSFGFSLIELMAVVVIIAIICAVAVPGIVEIRYRNSLLEMVNNAQEGAVLARTLALQTRKAAVLEVRSDMVWVNLLNGSYCTSDIERRCHRGFNGTNDIGQMEIAQGLADQAGVAMCGGNARVLTGGGEDPTTCDSEALPTDGFAVCYTGAGDLYVRAVADANAACDSTTAEPASTAWTRACGSGTSANVTFEDDTTYDLYDGALIVFNRYKTNPCTGEAEDVRRGLFLPTGGSPFNRVAGYTEESP